MNYFFRFTSSLSSADWFPLGRASDRKKFVEKDGILHAKLFLHIFFFCILCSSLLPNTPNIILTSQNTTTNIIICFLQTYYCVYLAAACKANQLMDRLDHNHLLSVSYMLPCLSIHVQATYLFTMSSWVRESIMLSTLYLDHCHHHQHHGYFLTWCDVEKRNQTPFVGKKYIWNELPLQTGALYNLTDYFLCVLKYTSTIVPKQPLIQLLFVVTLGVSLSCSAAINQPLSWET